MTHGDLQDIFILWFQENYPESRIFINHSGKAKINKKIWIPYGMPCTGGGSDLVAFRPGGITEFYEVKTKKDTLHPDQIRWANLVVGLGFDYFVVKEQGEGFEIVDYSLKNNI